MYDLTLPKSYYILEAQADGKPVSGFLVKMTMSLDLISRIKPHEKTDPEKVNELSKMFLSGEKQNMPIILGTSKYIDHSLVVQNIPEIKRLDSLIIIDGHHRYEALKRLYETGIETFLLAWITSIHDLTISSFVKVFSYDSHEFLDHILKKYSINPKKKLYSTKGCNEINLFHRGEYFTIQFSSIELFLKEIDMFENFIEKGDMKLISIIDQEMHANTSLQELDTSYLYFSHSSIEHAPLLVIIEKNELLPRHSTCFKPKPNPLIAYDKISQSLIKIS